MAAEKQNEQKENQPSEKKEVLPQSSEPDTSEPDTSEPDTSEPDTSEPDTSEDSRVSKARSDAAKYRTRLRDTEQKLETAQAQYTTLLADTLALIAKTQRIAHPETLWKLGEDPTALLEEDGHLNPEKAETMLKELASKHGLQIAPHGVYNRMFGQSPAPEPPTKTIADVFKA